MRWEWVTAAGPQIDSSARVDFPPTTMGARREQVLFVQNVGRAAFTMTEFAKLTGSPVTLGLFSEPNSAFEVRWVPDVVVNPTEKQPVTVIFSPPITEERFVDYSAEVEFRPAGAGPSLLTINGRAIAGECDVPSVIDFGSVPIGSSLDEEFSLRNDGASPVTVTSGGVTGAPVGIFEINGLGNEGRLLVDANSSPNAKVNFKPTEPRDYNGEFVIRRADSCPQRTVQVRGRGVVSCLTWRAAPPEDSTASSLHFGSIAPGSVAEGTITFSNACSLDINISRIRTTDPVFVVTAADPTDVTLLKVPASTRAADQTWAAGTGVTVLDFRPTVLGPKTGQLMASTSLASQPALSINLRGFGGGPRIEVRPSPVFAIGRVGFTAGASPGTFSQRTLRVANVGNRPSPPDPRANLHLGMNGQGTTYWSVRAITGTDVELCVGDWDAVGNACAGTLSAATYNVNDGIEAAIGAALNLPVRVIPQTAGPKEWELTLYSNDTLTPAVTVRITAEAIDVPPCNYTVSPTDLAFGIMDVPQVRDLTFTLTNLGTAPTELCYFNGLGLSPTSHDTFSMPGVMSDVVLNPGQSQVVTVRAQPLSSPMIPTMVSGEASFNVSTPGASQGAVLLSATLAPACLTLAPSPVNFQDTELECGSPERAVVISNTCAQTVTLNSTVLTNAANAPAGSGSCTNPAGCPQFAITSAPVGGPLAPGASRTVLLRYRPYLVGPATGEVTVTMQQGSMAVPYAVALNGNGRARTMAGCGVTAMCPGPITVNANSTVTLTPSIMAPGATTCNWAIASRPTTSSGNFSAPNSCSSTTYFADVVGTHIVNFNVSDGLGGTAQCTTPITVNPNGDLWIELTWDRPNDMDLHLLHPMAGPSNSATSWNNSVYDCHWLNKTPSWPGGAQASPSLDRDDITGRGPENTRINAPSRTVAYTVGVHMYSWSASPNAVTSTLKVYCGGQLMTTSTRTMSVTKQMWVAGTINFGAGTPCLYSPINTTVNVP
ncbi:MAG: choice-of-anchor D domain-containing protein [Archangium sp.]|nr:choice-of-anchor D domain-containing protein [Archangium sp.]